MLRNRFTLAVMAAIIGLLFVASTFGDIQQIQQAGYSQIDVAGSPLTPRTVLNFASGASCVDNSGTSPPETDCTITGGGGGGSPSPGVSLTFSPTAGSTTTLTHNFGNADHYTFCQDSSGNIFTPSEVTLGSNADTIFVGAAMTSVTCTAMNTALSNGVNTVSFSATPAFNAALGNIQAITLTGNVTSWTVTNLAVGQMMVWHICQDGTGSRTFAGAPAAVHGFFTIGSTASLCNDQALESPDGTHLYATSTGVINQ